MFNQTKIQTCLFNSCLTIVLLINPFCNFQCISEVIFAHDDVNNKIHDIEYSWDSTKVITAGGYHAMIWDVETGKLITALPPEPSGGGLVAFSPDDKTVATTWIHQQLFLWDWQSGEKLKSYQWQSNAVHPESGRELVYAANGQKIYIGESGGRIIAFNLLKEDYEMIQLFSDGGNIFNLFLYPQGDKAIFNRCVIDLKTYEELHMFDSIAFLKNDGKEILSYQIEGSFPNSTYTPMIWDANTFQLKETYPSFMTSNLYRVSPDFRLIMTAYTNAQSSQIKPDMIDKTDIFEIDTTNVKRVFMPGGKDDTPIDIIKFSPNGKKVALVSGKTVYLYDISDLTAFIENSEDYR